MNANQTRGLAALYATWDTAKLTDEMAQRRDVYAPEALELMAKELARRNATELDADSIAHTAAPSIARHGHSIQQPKTGNQPYIQYVGAWGLNILLGSAMGIPLTIVLNHMRPRGEGSAAIIMLMAIVAWLLVSFVAFRLSVKWMIVDRLLQRLRADGIQEDTEQTL